MTFNIECYCLNIDPPFPYEKPLNVSSFIERSLSEAQKIDENVAKLAEQLGLSPRKEDYSKSTKKKGRFSWSKKSHKT